MFCSNCGKELKEEANFCPNCGRPVKKKERDIKKKEDNVEFNAEKSEELEKEYRQLQQLELERKKHISEIISENKERITELGQQIDTILKQEEERLTEKEYCPKCGLYVGNAIFCQYCGTKIE